MKVTTPPEILRAAFNSVCNQLDWKARVDHWVPSEDVPVILEAIEFMTATRGVVVDEACSISRVVADGYRAGPAGDH